MARKEPPPDHDPLHKLNKKALRKLARKYKIKNFQRKSPSALRRAIRRAQEYKDTHSVSASPPPKPQILGLATPTTAPSGPPMKKISSLARLNLTPQKTVRPDQTIQTQAQKAEKDAEEKPLDPQEARRREALKAYQEHRLRYLFSPSKFVHAGTHEEYLLKDEEDLLLPDIYEEEELMLMPIDPFQIYLYWDFNPKTLAQVKDYLAQEYAFAIRVYDITDIQFDGRNAHYQWDTLCHPLVREWYINTEINGCNTLAELGVMDDAIGFVPLLRSNPIYIPPENVSSIRQDVFGRFEPRVFDAEKPPRPSEQPLRPVTGLFSSDAMLPLFPLPSPPTTEIPRAFFQDFTPTPVLFHPPPPPLRIMPEEWHFTPHFVPETPTEPPPPAPVPAAWNPPLPPLPAQPAFEPELIPVRATMERAEPASAEDGEPVYETRFETSESRIPVETQLAEFKAGGFEQIKEWLGVPQSTEIRWFSELPEEALPVIFHEWISDPYDQALFVSYSIWPWEWSEYMPLGSSDWAQRRYLGASLFSWFKPGASERLVSWMPRKPGASERIKWLRPRGASERPWSGFHRPPGASERHIRQLWPSHASGRQLYRKWSLGI